MPTIWFSNLALGPLTTYRVGGRADLFVLVEDPNGNRVRAVYDGSGLLTEVREEPALLLLPLRMELQVEVQLLVAVHAQRHPSRVQPGAQDVPLRGTEAETVLLAEPFAEQPELPVGQLRPRHGTSPATPCKAAATRAASWRTVGS